MGRGSLDPVGVLSPWRISSRNPWHDRVEIQVREKAGFELPLLSSKNVLGAGAIVLAFVAMEAVGIAGGNHLVDSVDGIVRCHKIVVGRPVVDVELASSKLQDIRSGLEVPVR